jgi:hypothetical protein
MKTDMIAKHEKSALFDKGEKSKTKLSTKARKPLVYAAFNTIAWAAPKLARIAPLRRFLANALEKRMRINSQAEVDAEIKPEKAGLDRLEIGIAILRSLERAIGSGCLSRQTVLKVLRILGGGVFINKGEQNARKRFMEKLHQIRQAGLHQKEGNPDLVL